MQLTPATRITTNSRSHRHRLVRSTIAMLLTQIEFADLAGGGHLASAVTISIRLGTQRRYIHGGMARGYTTVSRSSTTISTRVGSVARSSHATTLRSATPGAAGFGPHQRQPPTTTALRSPTVAGVLPVRPAQREIQCPSPRPITTANARKGNGTPKQYLLWPGGDRTFCGRCCETGPPIDLCPPSRRLPDAESPRAP